MGWVKVIIIEDGFGKGGSSEIYLHELFLSQNTKVSRDDLWQVFSLLSAAQRRAPGNVSGLIVGYNDRQSGRCGPYHHKSFPDNVDQKEMGEGGGGGGASFIALSSTVLNPLITTWTMSHKRSIIDTTITNHRRVSATSHNTNNYQ